MKIYKINEFDKLSLKNRNRVFLDLFNEQIIKFFDKYAISSILNGDMILGVLNKGERLEFLPLQAKEYKPINEVQNFMEADSFSLFNMYKKTIIIKRPLPCILSHEKIINYMDRRRRMVAFFWECEERVEKIPIEKVSIKQMLKITQEQVKQSEKTMFKNIDNNKLYLT
jgi:hypothetical protein